MVTRRYGYWPIVVTTNKLFAERGEVFPSAAMALVSASVARWASAIGLRASAKRPIAPCILLPVARRQWPRDFQRGRILGQGPDAACVVTLVDRLIHRSEVLSIEGESYRLKEAKERAAQRTQARRKKANKA